MATREELLDGLRQAHEAGNTDHAQVFADAIRKMDSGPDRSLGGDITAAIGGLNQSRYDLPQSAAVLATRGTDLLGLTDNVSPRLKAEFAKPENLSGDPNNPQFGTFRFIGDVATPIPGASGLKVVKGVKRTASAINNAARGTLMAAPMVNQSESNPETTLGMGAAVGTVAPFLAKFAPLVGAGYGGYTGYQRGGFAGAAEGAAIGGAVGSAPGIIGKVASRGLDKVFTKGAVDANKNAAASYVASTMPTGMTMDELAASTAPNAAQAMGESGGRAPTALATLARRQGTTAENVVNTVGPYNAQEAKNARVLNSVWRNVGADPAAAQNNIEAVVDNGRKIARPIYEVANAGGSMAPLQTQYENAFNKSISAERAAQKKVADAERQILLLKAEQSQGKPVGNGIYDAQAEAMSAQKEVEAAQADKQLVLDHLRNAQADEANGVKGGIWSPWLSRFLNDPIGKQGLKEGLEVQRIEALKENRPFNPTEYAITGKDELGDPIVSRVPNMRLLDATKRGLDTMINAAKDPVTKQIKWDERLRAIDGVRRRLLGELKTANPDYAKALSVSGDYLSSQEAFQKGQQTILNDHLTLAQFNQIYNKLTQAERGAFKGGIANLFFDKAETLKLKEGAVLTPLARKKFAAVLGEDKANAFIKDIEREVANQKFSRYVMPQNGSGTMGFSQEADRQDIFGDASFAERMLHRMTGPRAMGVTQAARRTAGEEAGSKLDFLRTAGLTQGGRDEAGNIFTMPPAQAAAILRRLQVNSPQQMVPFGWGGYGASAAHNLLTKGEPRNDGR